MHTLEKILARASGKSTITTGEIVNARVSIAGINDLYLQVLKSFESIGARKVWDPERVVFFFDHYAPPPTIRSAQNHKLMREFAHKYHIRHVFDINTGVCHQVMLEAGLALPGELIIITDSHTTMHGAVGAFGTGVGATDMAIALVSGEIWLRCPEIQLFEIKGEIPSGAMAKDVILYVTGQVGTDAAIYQAIEYGGSTVEGMSLEDRMVLCNMAVELGAKTSYIAPNERILECLKGYAPDAHFDIMETDGGYQYKNVRCFEIHNLSPQVAVPHTVDKVVPVEQVENQQVHQGFIGSCTGGRLSDLQVAARILKNHHISSSCRLVVIPASKRVLCEAIERGILRDLLDAGATICPPGCGPCLGAHQGVLAPSEVCISSASRNFLGRMGSSEALIYLGSPATVAASMLQGCITDPRILLL